QAQDEADGPGHHLAGRVVDDVRVDQANVPAARLDDASPGGLNILPPLAVATVGQRDHVVSSVREDVHRRAADPAARAADVGHHGEAWRPPGDVPQDRIGEGQVEAGDGLGDRHLSPGYARSAGTRPGTEVT